MDIPLVLGPAVCSYLPVVFGRMQANCTVAVSHDCRRTRKPQSRWVLESGIVISARLSLTSPPKSRALDPFGRDAYLASSARRDCCLSYFFTCNSAAALPRSDTESRSFSRNDPARVVGCRVAPRVGAIVFISRRAQAGTGTSASTTRPPIQVRLLGRQSTGQAYCPRSSRTTGR